MNIPRDSDHPRYFPQPIILDLFTRFLLDLLVRGGKKINGLIWSDLIWPGLVWSDGESIPACPSCFLTRPLERAPVERDLSTRVLEHPAHLCAHLHLWYFPRPRLSSFDTRYPPFPFSEIQSSVPIQYLFYFGRCSPLSSRDNVQLVLRHVSYSLFPFLSHPTLHNKSIIS